MNKYDYICKDCGEEHSYVTGRITQGSPSEIIENKEYKIVNPHPSIHIVDEEKVFVNGIIPLYTPELDETIELDNWCVINYGNWIKSIKSQTPIEGHLYFKVDLFNIEANRIFKIGYDDERDNFLFFTELESSDLYRWQTIGLKTKEIRKVFSSFFHKFADKNVDNKFTVDIDEALKFLVDNSGKSFVHALIGDEIIFQLVDSFGLEKPSSGINGIGMDIPIDTTNINAEYKILGFSRLSEFTVHNIDGIKLYQYDYIDDREKLKMDVFSIITEVYGGIPSEIKYQLLIRTELK